MESVHKKIILDLKDQYLLKKYSWYLTDRKPYQYPCAKINNKKIKLHNLILFKKKGFEVDHINRNRFDNRSCNLRYVTHQQNCMNRSKNKNSTSGYKGVTWYKPLKKWRAQIRFKNKKLHLGLFDTAEEAASIYQAVARELFREYLGEIEKI